MNKHIKSIYPTAPGTLHASSKRCLLAWLLFVKMLYHSWQRCPSRHHRTACIVSVWPWDQRAPSCRRFKWERQIWELTGKALEAHYWVEEWATGRGIVHDTVYVRKPPNPRQSQPAVSTCRYERAQKRLAGWTDLGGLLDHLSGEGPALQGMLRGSFGLIWNVPTFLQGNKYMYLLNN